MKTTLTYRLMNMALVLAVLLSANAPELRKQWSGVQQSVAGKHKKETGNVPDAQQSDTVIKAALGPGMSPVLLLLPQLAGTGFYSFIFRRNCVALPAVPAKPILVYFKVLFVSLICVNAP